ncbi:RNA polymerase sigma-70 factor (ECF subfamily) [Granulicella aggregans]|uniref:RNA polymerase sigma factor n=1 Tax=Granulicella aggregans TaxID=474949 RepID=A0A7W7Z9I1_9BACT|nr:sigma-70 family RNA polymerase sigma factor [Granulicella aggregans]MBB5055514.1 RNA polymerase sigma-70 factor (ECF subfamily) [Granulicella aggregans]
MALSSSKPDSAKRSPRGAESDDFGKADGTASEDEIPDEILDESGEESEDSSAETQQDEDFGVTPGEGDDDMATLAVNPDLGNGRSPNALPVLEFLRSDRGYEGMEDSEVMLRLRAGDMAAFDYLLARYRRPIIHFMYRMVHNESVAEELAQEVFLRVYRSRESYRAEAKFSTWLYRIATNLGVNHARDTRHERAASTVYLDETDEETGTSVDVADSTPGVEDKILRRERMAAIKQHVMALPERQQMAVLMHKYEGMDYKQIGEVLKLSESATKSLLFRAYQTLREKLKDFV